MVSVINRCFQFISDFGVLIKSVLGVHHFGCFFEITLVFRIVLPDWAQLMAIAILPIMVTKVRMHASWRGGSHSHCIATRLSSCWFGGGAKL